MLQRDGNSIEKIALCRPVVSCGQDIGFLPGSIGDKIGTYLAPLFDELGHYIELKELNHLMNNRVIEIIPLSMMRGRSFNNTFVILDEAQNATYEELRMLLTRVGKDSKMILAGDSTQSDMPGRAFDQVTDAIREIDEIDEIGVVELTYDDIVRNSLIKKIITALDRAQYAPVATNDFSHYNSET